MRNVRENSIREMGIFLTEEEIKWERWKRRICEGFLVVVFSILYFMFFF